MYSYVVRLSTDVYVFTYMYIICCIHCYVLIVAILHAFSIYQNDVNKVDLCVMKKETKLLYDMCDVGDGER